jgi:molecular chaperone GrpE (heat shock protein)
MAEILDLDAEFTAQMLGLSEQAKQEAEDRAARRPAATEPGAAGAKPAAKSEQVLPEVLRPLLTGLQALSRVTVENTRLLTKLDQAIGKSSAESNTTEKGLVGVVAELQTVIEQRNGVSRQMFDALHEELRSYKDGFLLDTVHRPMIRDLISLFDDMAEIRRQMHAAVAEQSQIADGGPMADRLRQVETHIEHNLEFITEVLARLEVTPLPAGTGKLDKRTQRVISVEPAESAEADNDLVRTVKRGFLWKERVVRPEEVVIRKWKDASGAAPQSGQV